MDPVSIAASSASLAVFCLKVAAAVYTTTDSIRNVDANFSGLHQELTGFSHTLSAIEKTWRQNTTILMAYSGPDATLWTSVTENLDNSKLTLEMLERALTNVKKGGFFGHGILAKPTKAVKLSLSMADITAYQHRINSHHIAMQGGLQMISLCLHIKGNASLQSLDTSLGNLGDLIKAISQRVETTLQDVDDPSLNTSREENGNSNLASGLQSMVRAAESVFTSANTVIDGRRSTIYGGSVIGDNEFQNDRGRIWGGSVLGTPLTEEQYSGIEKWITPPAKDKEDGTTNYQSKSTTITTGNPPTTDNADFLGKAINAVKQAIAFDNARDYEKAYKQYYICLELFMLAIKFEKKSESKRIMQNKAAEYMDRAEKLSAYLKTQATGLPMKPKRPIVSRTPTSPGIPLVLPPSTSTRRFEDYIIQASNICGVANVKIITKAEEIYKKLLNALDMMNLNITDRESLLVSAIVRPREPSQAQEIVRLCNTFEIPIWSFSGGGDGDYRAAIPRVPGSIGLDFGCYMNKVLGVNESGEYIVVEPGATYADINQYLVDKGLHKKFEPSWPEYVGESAIGNIAEGSMLTLYRGREIILPNGDLLKTGKIQFPEIQLTTDVLAQNGQPEIEQNQTSRSSPGAFKDKLLPENGIGITMKLAICLTPKSGHCQLYQIEFSKDGDLPKVVSIIRRLRQTMVIQRSSSLYYELLDTSIRGPKPSYVSSNASLNNSELENTDAYRWRLHGTIHGEKLVCDVLCQIIKEAFAQIEGAKINFLGGAQQEQSALQVRSKQFRKTSIDELWTKWTPNGSYVFFRLTSDVCGEIANAQFSITKKRIQEAGFNFVGTFTIDQLQMHYVLYVVYESYDSDSCRRVHKLIRTLMDDCGENGWSEYWTYGALMDQITATRDDPEDTMAKINTVIRDAIDPTGIMEPGRNGVWPTRSDKSVWKRMADRSLMG